MARTKKAASTDGFIFDNMRKVALAGVGAAVLAKEQAEDVAKKCISRGTKYEPRLKLTWKKLSGKRDKFRKTFGTQAGKVATEVGSRFKDLLGYLPIVTKNDMSTLVNRIEKLSSKVDTITKRKKK